MALPTGPISVQGTIKNIDGTPFTGIIILRLNRYASVLPAAGGPIGLVPVEIPFSVVNGNVVGSRQIYGNDALDGDTYYIVRVIGQNGQTTTFNTQILGDVPFDLGSLTPYTVPAGTSVYALSTSLAPNPFAEEPQAVGDSLVQYQLSVVPKFLLLVRNGVLQYPGVHYDLEGHTYTYYVPMNPDSGDTQYAFGF